MHKPASTVARCSINSLKELSYKRDSGLKLKRGSSQNRFLVVWCSMSMHSKPEITREHECNVLALTILTGIFKYMYPCSNPQQLFQRILGWSRIATDCPSTGEDLSRDIHGTSREVPTLELPSSPMSKMSLGFPGTLGTSREICTLEPPSSLMSKMSQGFPGTLGTSREVPTLLVPCPRCS